MSCRENAMHKLASPLALALLLVSALPSEAQYTAKEWPDGPMKQRFSEACGACHDINRVRVGYTPQGWLTIARMMQNAEAPVPAEEWPALTST
jgi:virginiamycin B lyase